MRKSFNLRVRSLRIAFETLEDRLPLHGDPLSHALESLGHASTEDGPSGLVGVLNPGDEGPILGRLSTAEEIAQGRAPLTPIDPHLLDDPNSEKPIDFDKLLGIPQSVAGPEAEVLPDFFPQLDSSISVDQTSQSGRTLIRFGTRVNNQGEGPAILISGRPGVDTIPSGAPITSWVNPDGSQNVLQAIYSYNGSSFTLSRYVAGGRFTYHTGHGHFHFDGYAYYRLRHNVGGTPGAYVTRPDGTGVVGEKTGFCLINTSSSFIRENGQSSTTIPGYGRPGQPGTGCGLLQGVHVGHSDQYSSGLEGQWLDVTGVPNGQYFLEIQLDGENAILETTDANNAKTFAYTLNVNNPGGGIAPDTFDAGSNSNNTFATAADLGVMGTYNQTGLSVHWGQDFDYFRFQASSTGTYNIVSTPANGNIDLYLYDANQNLVDSSTNSSGTDTVSIAFVQGETYYIKAQTYNSTTSSNYQIAWSLKPLATSATQVATAQEFGNRGRFVIGRNGPTAAGLTVNFSLSGTATNGVDYVFVPGSVTLGSLQSEAVIEIIPLRDGVFEGAETVILTLNSNAAYVVGATGSQLSILDERIQIAPSFEVETPGGGGGRDASDGRRLRRLSIFDTQE